MKELFTTSYSVAGAIVLTGFVIYAALILFTRIAGNRSFSKMSSFDFAMTVAIGSLLSTTILSPSVSLLEGVIGLAIVYALQIGAALLRKYKWFKSAIDNTPLLLMDGSHILHENLKKARVEETDLRSKLREANVCNINEVKAVVFETTGDISVIHRADVNEKLNEWLLEGVKR